MPEATPDKGQDGEKKVKQRGSPNWPQDGVISLRVEHNPKRKGTKAFVKFERYRNKMTVKEFIESGGTYTSLKWDTEHGFIAVNETKEQRAAYEAEQKAKASAKADKAAATAAKKKAAADKKAADKKSKEDKKAA